MGVVLPNTELSPMNPYADRKSPDGKPWPPTDVVRPWDPLSADEKKLSARMAEVYAGYCICTDHEIGRLIDYLDMSGQLDNTLIVVIADNGASGEGGPNGSVNENKFFSSVPDDMAENLKMIDKLGSADTYNHYAIGWAMAFDTPFKLYKRYARNGGICDPMIVHWPKGIKAKGELRDQYTHCSDIVPTVYDCLGIELPAEVKRYTRWPLEGQSFKYTFEDAKVPIQKETLYYVMLGTRGVWHEGWKADTVHPAAPGDWSHFSEDVWELYNTDQDRSDSHNLVDQEPVKLRELQDLWFVEAGKYFGLPMEDRSAVAILTTPRPQMSPPRSRYIYYPRTLEVPESVAVNVRGRSFKIAAGVIVETPEAEGVLFAQCSKFGRHALYLKDGKLKYVYNWLGEKEQMITSDVKVPQGKCVLGVEFVKEKLQAIRNSPVVNQCIGTATLYINDKPVGEYKGMATQVGKFALCGEGLNVGRDGSGNVTDDYAGDMPWSFAGGVIEKVIVDMAEEPYRNLELEAMEVLSRE